jgi:hypothetical protein
MYPADARKEAFAAWGAAFDVSATADSGTLTVRAPAARAVPLPRRKSRRRTFFSISPVFPDLAIVGLLPFNTTDAKTSRFAVTLSKYDKKIQKHL